MDQPLFSAKHILVIQPLVGIGDMIWHKPWIDALAHDFPLTLATKPTVRAEMLFYNTGKSFSVLSIERSLRGRKGRHDGITGFFRLVSDFRKTGADTAIILHHSARYALAARLAGIKRRLGYGTGRQRAHLNAGHFLEGAERGGHAIDRVSCFATKNGFGLKQPKWHIHLSDAAKDEAAQFLAKHGLLCTKQKVREFLVIGIGAMHPERQWGAEKFAELMARLSKDRPDLAFVVIAGPAEQQLIAEIKGHLSQQQDDMANIIVQAGPLDVVTAVMARSIGYVGNDTGFLNLMACLSRPALGFYSQSKPLTYTPFLKKLDLFKDDEYGTPGLIDRISVSAVMQAISIFWPETASQKQAKK